MITFKGTVAPALVILSAFRTRRKHRRLDAL
jgi:hypothetical protein